MKTDTEPKWRVELENDTGPNDDCYHEWWVVLDGERFSFRCDFESGAKWLCGVLNEHQKLLDSLKQSFLSFGYTLHETVNQDKQYSSGLRK
jgi:hypothetical protein